MDDRPLPVVAPPDRSPPVGPGSEPVVWFIMPDGLRVGLRPIHPDDREALMEGFASLSEDSRYHRFLTPMPRLSDRQARYLTEIDQVNHFAWGIGVPDGEDGLRGIGVARYVRDRDDPSCAEVAVAISDEYQGRGLGSLLVRALAVVARSHGIERIAGTMLVENRAMVRIFLALGGQVHSAGRGLVQAEAALQDDDPCDLGEAACGALIRVADRAAHPSSDHRRGASGSRE